MCSTARCLKLRRWNMSRFEIYLSKNDLEHIANGYDVKIKINGKRFLETN